MTNPIGSTTKTSTVITHKNTISLKTNHNIVYNPTVAKNNNTTKCDFDGTSIKNQNDIKLQIEGKTVSYSYVMEAIDSLTKLILRALTLIIIKLII